MKQLGGYRWRKSSHSTNGAECIEVGQAPWRKSIYSGNGGTDCVEVGAPVTADGVLVRDTKDRGGPMLRFSPAAWPSFAARVRHGER